MTAEASLAFRQKSLFQTTVETVEEDAKENLSGDVEEGDVSVVVVKMAAPLPSEEMDDCGVVEVLRNISLTLLRLNERSHVFHKLAAIVLVDLSRDRLRLERFPLGELLHGPDGFMGRGWEVEVGVGP
nr:unnamed protein product [Spirometra erinaceieuropaei]